jgi:pimeloyl-ACP methyl ester carboxylesterase
VHVTSPKSETVTILGARIHLRRAGEGPPLLFLHGAGGVPVWLPLFEKLAESFELVVPDHPGFGASDTPPWLRNIGDAAFYYLDFVEALKLGRPHVVGTSLGGWIAAEAAVRDPAAFARLTLVAPAGLRVAGVPAGDPFIWSHEEHVRNLYHDQSYAERMLAAPVTPEAADLQIKNRFAFARLAWQPRLFNPDLERWLHRIKAPVQLIWGNEDKLLPVTYAQAWLKRLSKASLLPLPQCGHLPHVERAEAVANAIRSFAREAAS